MNRVALILCFWVLAGCQQASIEQVKQEEISEALPKRTLKLCKNKNLSPNEIFTEASESIVVISTSSSQGSGFIVKHDDRYTYILTNSHVVEGNDEVVVSWLDKRKEKGKVIADYGADTLQRDVALVRVDAIRSIPLVIDDDKPVIGTDVVVIGAPKGLDFSLSRGIVSQIRENGDFIQVDAPVNPGNSGGPLLDKNGCVIGLITFKKEDSEGLNFAIGRNPINHFLENPAIERKIIPKTKTIVYEPYILVGPRDAVRPSGEGWSWDYRECHNLGRGSKNVYDKIPCPARLIKGETISDYWIRYTGRRGRYAHAETCKTSRQMFGNGKITTYPCRQYRNKHRVLVDCENWFISMDDISLEPILSGSQGEEWAVEACKKGQKVVVSAG